jgi:hypothetical protein
MSTTRNWTQEQTGDFLQFARSGLKQIDVMDVEDVFERFHGNASWLGPCELGTGTEEDVLVALERFCTKAGASEAFKCFFFDIHNQAGFFNASFQDHIWGFVVWRTGEDEYWFPIDSPQAGVVPKSPATQSAPSTYDELIAVVADPRRPESERISALSTLGDLRDPRAVDFLCGRVERGWDRQSFPLFIAAIRSLGKLGDPRSFECLRRVFGSYGDPSVLRAASETLLTIGSPWCLLGQAYMLNDSYWANATQKADARAALQEACDAGTPESTCFVGLAKAALGGVDYSEVLAHLAIHEGIRFKSKSSQASLKGESCTFFEFEADSKEAALSFLHEVLGIRRQDYFVVDTPDGAFGKCQHGILEGVANAGTVRRRMAELMWALDVALRVSPDATGPWGGAVVCPECGGEARRVLGAVEFRCMRCTWAVKVT